MPRDTGQFMLLVAGLSMLVTPLVAAAGQRLGAVLELGQETRLHTRGLGAPPELENHVITAGFGRVGEMLGRILDRMGIPFLALDKDGLVVDRHRGTGTRISYGDASRIEMLRRSRADAAAAVLVTIDDWGATERIIRNVRRQWPELLIYARARPVARQETHCARGDRCGSGASGREPAIGLALALWHRHAGGDLPGGN
jgi:monovalent cation:H+ antiporter-2, CPA2 family